MDSDVAPERGLSSSMGLYSHEGEGEGGGGRASAPGVSRTEPAGLGMPWPGRRQAQEAPKTVPGTLRSCTTRFQTENALVNFLLLGRPRLPSSPSSTSSSSSLFGVVVASPRHWPRRSRVSRWPPSEPRTTMLECLELSQRTPWSWSSSFVLVASPSSSTPSTLK